MRRACTLIPLSLLACGVAGHALAGSMPPRSVAQIGEALPVVAELPGAGLLARTEQRIGGSAPRAPFPCADDGARGLPGTARWGEWTARGAGRSVRVITFAYSNASIGSAWRTLRTAIGECPRTSAMRADDGSRGTATLAARRLGDHVVRMDVLTRSVSGSGAWSTDRAIVYQRVGDAIQKVTVTRRIATPRDRALAMRVARVSRQKYLRMLTGPAATRPAGSAAGAMDGLVARAVANLPAGAKLNVAMGDSMASGEAGRWRGNVFSQVNWAQADAYGEQAYWDTPTGEAIPGCHRARGASIHVPGTYAINLACSGAMTTSMWSTNLLSYGQYKAGIDEGAVDPSTGARMPGQLTMLSQVARSAPIGTIVMSIGGNDMGFAEVVTACMAAFMRPWPFAARCKDQSAVRSRLSDEALEVVERKVEAAIMRVHATMEAAGYATGSWQLIIPGFPRLIAGDSRYADTLTGRLYQGGCPIHSADVAWLNDRLPMIETMREAARRASAATGQPVHVLDLTNVFAGRELCARGAEHVDRMPASDIVGRAERVQMARVLPPFALTEGMHPNQIGQQALQACVREAMNGGAARSGRCDAPADWSLVDGTGLPLVRFTPVAP
jgi:hypothetical protein